MIRLTNSKDQKEAHNISLAKNEISFLQLGYVSHFPDSVSSELEYVKIDKLVGGGQRVRVNRWSN